MELFGQGFSELESAASKCYPFDVATYKGFNVGEIVLKAGENETLNVELNDSNINSSQLSYVGYIPTADIFVAAFDCWLTNDDEERAGYTDSCLNTVYWKITDDGKVHDYVYEYGHRMVYGGLYKELKKRHQIIDILLD